MLEFLDGRLPQRFWDKVIVDPSGCWLWAGAITGGRGQIRWSGADGITRTMSAYRIAFEVTHGAIDPSLTIDHTCEVLLCVNPKHLEQVTAEENTRRFYQRHPITHCPRGHDLSVVGFYPGRYSNGVGKRCKVCSYAWSRDWKSSRRQGRAA